MLIYPISDGLLRLWSLESPGVKPSFSIYIVVRKLSSFFLVTKCKSALMPWRSGVLLASKSGLSHFIGLLTDDSGIEVRWVRAC